MLPRKRGQSAEAAPSSGSAPAPRLPDGRLSTRRTPNASAVATTAPVMLPPTLLTSGMMSTTQAEGRRAGDQSHKHGVRWGLGASASATSCAPVLPQQRVLHASAAELAWWPAVVATPATPTTRFAMAAQARREISSRQASLAKELAAMDLAPMVESASNAKPAASTQPASARAASTSSRNPVLQHQRKTGTQSAQRRGSAAAAGRARYAARLCSARACASWRAAASSPSTRPVGGIRGGAARREGRGAQLAAIEDVVGHEWWSAQEPPGDPLIRLAACMVALDGVRPRIVEVSEPRPCPTRVKSLLLRADAPGAHVAQAMPRAAREEGGQLTSALGVPGNEEEGGDLSVATTRCGRAATTHTLSSCALRPGQAPHRVQAGKTLAPHAIRRPILEGRMRLAARKAATATGATVQPRPTGKPKAAAQQRLARLAAQLSELRQVRCTR